MKIKYYTLKQIFKSPNDYIMYNCYCLNIFIIIIFLNYITEYNLVYDVYIISKINYKLQIMK